MTMNLIVHHIVVHIEIEIDHLMIGKMSEVTEKFNYIKEHILKWEGGYVECKDGSDYKCTCMGISIDLYRYYYGYDKDCDDLQVIKENE